ncbi:MAG: N-6 DNA methylase [Clostridiales bacterium]|nr:N-6 DNA methylase [Clostridiales bacterium]
MTFRHLRNVRGFFSDYYLGSVFGRGAGRGGRRTLSDRETDLAYARFRRIRHRAEGRATDALTCRERFVRPLLRDVLGFHLGAGENGIHRLFPSAEAEAAGAPPVLLVYCGAWDEDLDAGRWKANPMRALGEALAREGVSYGFLVTGEWIRLIRVPGEGPQGAYLEVDLAGLDEEEDPESFAAFLKLFSVATFLPGKEGRRPIEEIERESRDHAERVSKDLKGAVFRAAESMVSGLIADAVARGELASPVELDEARLRTYRDAALLALYRILFILYAEARDPRLNEHPLYWKSYSATGLLEEILAKPGRVWPENRSFLWERLRALFRIYDEGLPAITAWEHIPPRGGDFFSRTTPEGQILDRARLPDRQVAQLMLDLATTPPRRGIGRERVSFRELDIESLGAVYEGLLEYEPRIAREVSFEVRIQGQDYVLPPAELVRLCQQKNLRLVGDVALVGGTEAERLHPNASVDESEDESHDASATAAETDLAEAEGEAVNEEAQEGVAKGATARLMRRLEPGAFHFVPGPGRKGSGSFYTPRALVRDLVRHTLGPLIEGKTAAEIERLRVLDPACGSGHFLVEAMRFLGQALHRAYVEEYGGKVPREFRSTTGQAWDTNWRASDEGARAANSEARAWCKRRIAERCLFGVDLNPTAVQLAQVALWIESLAGDRPLTYFQHHIRCGNSLVGTWMDRLEEPPLPAKGFNRHQLRLPFQEPVRQAIREAACLRRLIDEVRSEDLLREGIQPESTEEQRYRKSLQEKADSILAAAKLLFDLRSASAFVPEIWREWDTLTRLIDKPGELHAYAQGRPWWPEFERVRERERFFHWELEFPEVFVDAERPGFDVVLGNPPWDKIKPDRKEFYGRYDVLIRAYVGGDLDRRIRELHAAQPDLEAEFQAYEARMKTLAACLKMGGDYRFHDWDVDGKRTGGDPDAFKFFVERAWQLVRDGGRVGFVVPSAIYNNEGCTGLRHLLLEEAQVERFYAFENRRKIFPIDSRYKFVSLVFRKENPKPTADGFEAAFMRHELAELSATARYREPGQEKAKPFAAPWIVPIRRGELERLSPGTLAFLEYRSPRDREILLKMYGYDADGNPVNPRPLLGDKGPGTWNARFYREFDMTNDRDLWTDPKTGKLYNPRQILGPVPGTTSQPPYYDPKAWPEIRERMAEAGFWPLYQDAHIHQHVLEFKPFMRWVSLEAHERKYGGLPSSARKLVLRDRGRNSDERMVVAAVLPPRSCFGHSLNGINAPSHLLDRLCALLNALSFDFLGRQKNSGLHVSPYILRFCAVPPPDQLAALPPVPLIHAPHLETWIYNLEDRWPVLWTVERTVAEAYGLTPDDFEYILSTFPVFARKRPTFYAYLQERVQEWKREMEGAKVYAISAAGLARAAETADVYVTKPARQPAARAAFRQAAVLAWVVHKLHSPGYLVSRFRVQKMLYLIEAVTETGLFNEFRKQAAGPYDPGLRYKGPEDIAVRQRGWLVARGDAHFEPGPHIEEALRYAPRYIDTELAELVLEEFRTFKDETLERWTTVHLAAVELERRGEFVTPETVAAYIQRVPEWQPKLSREEFAPGRIADALEGLRRTGLLPAGGLIPRGGAT